MPALPASDWSDETAGASACVCDRFSVSRVVPELSHADTLRTARGWCSGRAFCGSRRNSTDRVETVMPNPRMIGGRIELSGGREAYQGLHVRAVEAARE
eukprot:1194437-Prorocentrum_minimum.AAC.1